MEKLLDSFLSEVAGIAGVRMAYLINNRGEILFPTAERSGRAVLNAAGALEVVQALGAFELAGEDVTEMELDFSEGKVMVYSAVKMNAPGRLGVYEAFLVLVGDRTFNKAHLRLTLNVALANLFGEKKYKKLGAPVRITRGSVLTRDKLSEPDQALVERIRRHQS